MSGVMAVRVLVWMSKLGQDWLLLSCPAAWVPLQLQCFVVHGCKLLPPWQPANVGGSWSSLAAPGWEELLVLVYRP